MSSASRSSSAQNLVALDIPHSISGKKITIQVQHGSTKINSNVPKNFAITRSELSERFRLALENYGRFSFVVYVEYECMMRAVHLHIVHGQYIEVEVGF